MSLSSAIYDALKTLPRPVFPNLAPEDVEPPWVVYRSNTSEDSIDYTLAGLRIPYWATVEINVWARGFEAAEALAETIIERLICYSSPAIQKILYAGQKETVDPDLNLYGQALAFKFYTNEV